MADLVETLLNPAVLGLVGAILGVFLAFILNSMRERRFEKRKTKYLAKLKAFEEMIDALSRVSVNLAHLKAMVAVPWPVEPREKLEDSTTRMIIAINLTREEERSVAGTAMQKLIDEYNAISSGPGDDQTKSTKFGEWVQSSAFGLTMLRFRLIDHWNIEMSRAFSKAAILIEGDEVDKKLEAVANLVNKELISATQDAEENRGLEALLSGVGALEKKIKDLREAMYWELESTL